MRIYLNLRVSCEGGGVNAVKEGWKFSDYVNLEMSRGVGCLALMKFLHTSSTFHSYCFINIKIE